MKNTIKHFNILGVWGILLFMPVLLHAQTRKTLWLHGGGVTSESWDNMKTNMTNLGYDFDDRINPPYGPATGAGSQSGADYITNRVSTDVNVLGIAHDFGGLVLRQAQLQTPQITAMILDGVPNHGSKGVAAGRPPLGNPNEGSQMEELINAIKQFQDIDDCKFCTLSGSFESWSDELKNTTFPFIDEMLPGSPVILNLNDPDNLPTVPFVILWGEVAHASLSQMMSSRAFPISGMDGGDPIGDRCNQKFEAEKSDIKGDKNKSIWGSIGGFLGDVFKGVASIVKGDPADIVGGIGQLISGSITRVNTLVSELKDLNERQERLARCKTADDILQLEWFGLLGQQLEEVEILVPDPDCETVYECEAECGVDMAWGDWDSNLSCEEYCAHHTDDCDQITITVIQLKPTDGLLTKSEQILEGGASEPYHLPNTNHFAEQVNTVVTQTLEDIFNGNAGAAFIVPK